MARTVESLKKQYKEDPTYKLQVDDTVKKSKRLYGVQLTKDDIFKSIAGGGFIEDYAKRKKAATKKASKKK